VVIQSDAPFFQSRSQTSAQRAWTEEAAQLRQNEAEWMQKFMNASKAQLEANDRAVAAESRLAGASVQVFFFCSSRY
jgi:hypothetical protein